MMGRSMGALAGATILAVGATVAVVALSRVPYQFDRSDSAVLRLAWRTRGVRVEECRPLTPDELANLPQHMQRTEMCEGRLLPYRLRVDVNGDGKIDQTIRPAGAREDRPLYVFQDIRVDPGDHEVVVRFTRDSVAGAEADATTPAQLVLEEVLAIAPREILLITYDPDRRALVVGGPDAR